MLSDGAIRDLIGDFAPATPRSSVFDQGPPPISDLRHPQYILNQENWEKWRLTYLGGSRFLKRYLRKMSKREDNSDFEARKLVSHVPAFAKSAINEVKNSIFQRITDVARDGGPQTYQDAVLGRYGGVDKLGSTMNTFIGRDLLPELLTMARVGVYVDMPPLADSSLAEKVDKRPYLYWYKAEDIRSWAMNDDRTGDPTEFKALLLRDSTYDIDAHWVLPYETTTRFRYMWLDSEDGKIHCRFYNQAGDNLNPSELGYEVVDTDEVILNIPKIPFVLMELSDSLLADVADYQISLLNLASSDISFALRANFPFYTEQVDPRMESPYMKPEGGAIGRPGQTGNPWQTETGINMLGGMVINTNMEQSKEVRVGAGQGRQYPVGSERPGFIHPSTEPMIASMKKQEQLKAEIRQLVHLAISSLQPVQQSAQSKDHDKAGLEAGLSYIGLELQHAERKLAEYWSMYEGSQVAATVNYPKNYSIVSDGDRREQAGWIKDIIPTVPSITFQREMAKKIVALTLDTTLSHQTLQKIYDEIDKAPVVHGDPSVIEMDVQSGLVSLETASAARGYPSGEVEKAKKDHEDRIKRIALAQSEAGGLGAAAGARGVQDMDSNPQSGKNEKEISQDPTLDDSVRNKTRGKGKKNVQPA